MVEIEIEVGFDTKEEADKLCDGLLNGKATVGFKHQKWIVFISCRADEILHLGQELHYGLL